MLSCFKTCETCPVEITCAHAREHLTRARARCASKDRRAREVREQGARALCARWSARIRARISSPNPLLESLFARAESLFARARASDGRAPLGLARAPRARAPRFARASRARACRCSRTSRAHVLNARALALRTPQLVRHHI